MKTVEVRYGQNLFDVAVSHTGNYLDAFRIAVENGISLTDIPADVTVSVPVANRNVTKAFALRQPATGFELSEPVQDGNGTSGYVDVTYTPPVQGYNARSGQNLFDIALQLTGNYLNAFELANINGLSLTDELTSWQFLKVLPVDNVPVLDFYTRYQVIPATGFSPVVTGQPTLEGIDYWAIEVDFVVQPNPIEDELLID